MNIVEHLDLAIKLNEIGTTNGEYTVPYKNGMLAKRTYMKNDEWAAFLHSMSPVTRKEYGESGGDELSEKDGRPPKWHLTVHQVG